MVLYPLIVRSPSSKGPRTRIEIGGVCFIREYAHNTKYWWDLDRVLDDSSNKEKLDKYFKDGASKPEETSR